MGRKVEMVTDDAEINVDLMMGSLQDILARASEENEPNPQDVYLADALKVILGVLAKYQTIDEAMLGGAHPQEIEYDMTQLTAWTTPIAIAGHKAKTAVKYLQGRGRRDGSAAFLQEKGRLERLEKKFVVAHGDHIKNKIKGTYEMKAAEAEMQAECLAQIVSDADSLCQVLKRVHDRQMKEYNNVSRS